MTQEDESAVCFVMTGVRFQFVLVLAGRT